MARHEVVIHENTSTATRESAPYLGSYIAKETVALTEFAVAVGAKCGLPAIQVIAIIGGAFDAIAALEREALVRVHTDLGVVCGVITGSFPTADAVFDPDRNALELSLRLDDTLRLDLADTVPTIITDANLTKLRVDNVMDLEVERPMNLIHGQHTFRVAGFNMVLGDEGATAFLQNALGTTFPLVIDHVTSHQLFTAHTAELLPGGDYKLVVKSRAGDAAGPLQTSFRKVKYLRVEDPVPVPIAQTSDGLVKVMSFADDETGDTFTFGNPWTALGEGFYSPEQGWEIEIVKLRTAPGEEPMGATYHINGGTRLEITMDQMDKPAAGEYPNASVEVGLVFNGDGEPRVETLTLPMRLVVGA